VEGAANLPRPATFRHQQCHDTVGFVPARPDPPHASIRLPTSRVGWRAPGRKRPRHGLRLPHRAAFRCPGRARTPPPGLGHKSSAPAHLQAMSSQTETVSDGCRVQCEPIVEGGNSIGLCRGNVQAPARIFEAAAADPPHLVLQPMQYREQKVAPGSCRVATGARWSSAACAHHPPTVTPAAREPGRQLRSPRAVWRSPAGANVQLRNRSCELVDADCARLELGGTGLGIGGVDGEDVGRPPGLENAAS